MDLTWSLTKLHSLSVCPSCQCIIGTATFSFFFDLGPCKSYIAQKESGFPKGRVSSRCNDVTTVTNTFFCFGIFSTIYYIERYNMLYRDIFSSKMQSSRNLLPFFAVSIASLFTHLEPRQSIAGKNGDS